MPVSLKMVGSEVFGLEAVNSEVAGVGSMAVSSEVDGAGSEHVGSVVVTSGWLHLLASLKVAAAASSLSEVVASLLGVV